jgi:hypothetical protein
VIYYRPGFVYTCLHPLDALVGIIGRRFNNMVFFGDLGNWEGALRISIGTCSKGGSGMSLL